MNEHQSNSRHQEPDRPAHGGSPERRYSPSLEALGIRNEDPEVVARWEEGITLWGWAFIAYTQLGVPELQTKEVLVAFERSYITSFPNREEFILHEMEALGWVIEMKTFLASNGIPNDVVRWDYDAMEMHMKDLYSAVDIGGRLHVFAQ